MQNPANEKFIEQNKDFPKLIDNTKTNVLLKRNLLFSGKLTSITIKFTILKEINSEFKTSFKDWIYSMGFQIKSETVEDGKWCLKITLRPHQSTGWN